MTNKTDEQSEKCRLRLCCRNDHHAQGCTTYDPARYLDEYANEDYASPDPDEIRAARKRAEPRLTQAAAAAMIGKSLGAWQKWESPVGSINHRKMDAALWELWALKLNETKGK